MKRSSFCLCVAIGLLTGTFLSAQEYRDAAAFGLKGKVKECSVRQENGSIGFSPYDYSKLSFDEDGKLEHWSIDFGLDRGNRVRHLSDFTRPGGILTGFTYSLTPEDSNKYHFRYRNDKLLFRYRLYSEFDSIFGYIDSTEGYLFTKVDGDTFVRVFFSIDVVNDHVTSLIEKNYTNSVDLLTALDLYAESTMSSLDTSRTTYKVLEKDAHGNFTKLIDTEDGRVTYQTITYWDAPAPSTPSSAAAPAVTTTPPATAKPSEPAEKPQAPKPAEETADFRAAAPKDLSFEDIVTRPFGVLPTDRRRCSRKQILSDLSKYGWKVTDRYGSFKVDKAGGYDLAILGEIPYDAGASFFGGDDQPGELYGFYYTFLFKTSKQAKQFTEKMISYLRSEGVEIPDPSKYSDEVSAMHGSSKIELTLPQKRSTYVFLYVYYWGGHYKDGKWETGWIE
ncbi:MAG: hypothetical protein IJL93_05125 [Bacteroidales bacterium]|nr:hypothetical protein [Bacteroidales bacterium]